MAYLFCIVAPAASFALADGPRTMPCFIAGSSAVDVPVAAEHAHMDGAMHDHAAMGHAAVAHHDTASVTDDDADHGATHKTSTMPCCGMSCPGALPVTLPEVRKPMTLTTLCQSLTAQSVGDNAPSRLYRPPIS